MSVSDDLIEKVMLHWRAKKDTYEIARALKEKEWVICIALRIGRERKLELKDRA